MIGISWPDLTFRPVNLWSVHAAWKLSKPSTGQAEEAQAVSRAMAEPKPSVSHMLAVISTWR